MTVQQSLPVDSVEHGANKTPAEINKLDRIFVPLSTEPFRWFASGRKRWELRRIGRQYTPRYLTPGRRVELRRGYNDSAAVVWGTLAEVYEAQNISRFFDVVDYRQVIPEASTREEAVRTATQILGDDGAPVIGFRVDVDPVTELPLHADFMPLVQTGKKQSTVRRGARNVSKGLADLIAGPHRLRVLITDVHQKPFEALTEVDARRDGFETLCQLEAALRRFYPTMSPSDPVTVIGFKPLFDAR